VDENRVMLEHREVEVEKAIQGEDGADVHLKPGDVLTIRQLGQWSEIGGSITVTGAVLYPGRYGIQQGERLSSVLRRAGGFLSDAYPAGAVLERSQVREIAKRSKEQLVQRLESQDTTGINAEIRQASEQQKERLLERLRASTASGRLVIKIQPNVAEWAGGDADIEVRPGDTLFVPKQPNFVVIDGQVYSPGAISFSPGRSADWYLKQAGGPSEFANKKDIFIVRANGSVIGRDSGGFWGGGVLRTRLKPGDTLVVPEKIVSGSSFWRDLAQSAQVVSAIAIAARVATSF
jgi:protein involved in polysaccharide export with SLBB domain